MTCLTRVASGRCHKEKSTQKGLEPRRRGHLSGPRNEPQAGNPAQHCQPGLCFDPRRPPYAAIDTDEHTMTFEDVRASSRSHEAARSRRTSKTQETPDFLHTGPVVTTVQAKGTFIPPTDHLAFDKAVTRAAGKIRRGEAELPLTLTGSSRWVQLVSLGEGGHHGAHLVRQILSRF